MAPPCIVSTTNDQVCLIQPQQPQQPPQRIRTYSPSSIVTRQEEEPTVFLHRDASGSAAAKIFPILTQMNLADAAVRFADFGSNNNNEGNDEQDKVLDAFQNVTDLFERLVDCAMPKAEQHHDHQNLIAEACAISLSTRVPPILSQTKELIEKAGQESQFVVKMRSTFALIRAMQYLDRIQEGMDPKANEELNDQLQTVLSGLDLESLPRHFQKHVAFRVSPWVTSVLCFDLPIGESAHASIAPHNPQGQLPLEVEVEPVVEFRGHDRASIRYARDAARACRVTIEHCTHVERSFAAGAGMAGEATIRVRVSPLQTDSGHTAAVVPQVKGVWNYDDTVADRIHFKEARAYVPSDCCVPKWWRFCVFSCRKRSFIPNTVIFIFPP
jgi:hypothetical protein